jgi:hypothetical protein
MLNEMMTVKSDDMHGRHQAYADMVQGKHVQTGGRTAAFDGLCCEIRGLGLEVTLGRVVDSFEPLPDRTCSRIALPEDATLEEQLQVSTVDKLEDDAGQKILEIPAGDYEPVVRPPRVPMITSVTNGRNGKQPQFELSQEPLIDDIDEPTIPQNGSRKDDRDGRIVNDFVDTILGDSFFGPDEDDEINITIQETTTAGKSSTARSNQQTPATELSSLIAPELDNEESLFDFPALSELQSLAQELMHITRSDSKVTVGGGDVNPDDGGPTPDL